MGALSSPLSQVQVGIAALTRGLADPGAASFSPGDFQPNPEPGNWAAKSL